MRKTLFTAAVLTCAVLAAGCANKDKGDSSMHSGGQTMSSTDRTTGSSDASASPAAATYTCTMHPEVSQSSPGNCPKCGMKLTAKR